MNHWPKTQSVCKHCGFSAEEHPVRYQIDGKYAYCGTFEPVAEPASTGEPPYCPVLGCPRYYGQDVPHDHTTLYPARPSGPSAPQVEPHVICGNCRKTLKWFPSEPHMNHENNDIHCYPGSEETVTLVYVTPVPQTSAEPQNKCDFCRDGDKPEGGFHKGIVSDYKCRADGPEHPIVGPEDGSPCCEHCAKHPGSQWTLKVSQPVSGGATRQFRHNHSAGSDYCPACTQPTGDATKVEEIAREIATATSACGSFNEIRRKTEAILRPYFPQTPDKITNDLCEIGRRVLNCLEKHRCPDGAIDEIESSMANLDRVIRKLRSSEPATPASTARTEDHKVSNEDFDKWQTDNGNMTDTYQMIRSIAVDFTNSLAAPGSVPQAPVIAGGRIVAAPEISSERRNTLND